MDLIKGNGNGLNVDFYNTDPSAYGLDYQRDGIVTKDHKLALQSVDNINFDWTGSPGAGVQSEHFAVQWHGQLLAPESGKFTFTTNADDGIRVYIDGNKIIDDWSDHKPHEASGSIDLLSGKHTIQVDYYQERGKATAQLFWQAPDISKQIVPKSYFYTENGAVTTTPSDSGVSLVSSSGASGLSPAFDDTTLPNEARPHGVPSYYSWATVPGINYGNNIPNGWNSFTQWGQLYVADGSPPPANSNTRVQIKAMDSWYLSKSSGQWIQVQHSDTVQGAAYVEDFANDANKAADIKDESKNGGGISTTAGNGYNFHFWTNRVTLSNPSDIGGIYTRFEARLVLNDPNGPDDRASSKYIASDGADYWRNVNVGWASDWSNNGAVGGGRFKKVTNDWQNFTMETLTPQQLAQNPPPYQT
jgi:PA14 domain